MATNTSANTFDLVKKSAKIGTLHADKVLIGGNNNGGWKSMAVTTLGAGNTIGTGSNLKVNDFRFKVEGTTLHIRGSIIVTGGATTGNATAAVYELTLPTGCTAKIPTGYYHPCVGSFQVYSSTGPTALTGVVRTTATVLSFWGLSEAVARSQWGHSSAAGIKLDSGEYVFGFSAEVELDPSSTILASTYV